MDKPTTAKMLVADKTKEIMEVLKEAVRYAGVEAVEVTYEGNGETATWRAESS